MGKRAGVLAAGGALALLLAACQPPPPPAPSSMSLGWHASGVNGPIAADPAENLLWAMDKSTGTLTALDASTGGVGAQHVVAMDSQEHFPTPAVVPNWVLIESGHHVVAFSTPAVASATSWASAPLDGIVQARPLVVNGTVVVATENDSLYGLHLSDGTTAWGGPSASAARSPSATCRRSRA
jgi:outer membrane protein assembly factor BamB